MPRPVRAMQKLSRLPVQPRKPPWAFPRGGSGWSRKPKDPSFNAPVSLRRLLSITLFVYLTGCIYMLL